jgi:hypothetical protein
MLTTTNGTVQTAAKVENDFSHRLTVSSISFFIAVFLSLTIGIGLGNIFTS